MKLNSNIIVLFEVFPTREGLERYLELGAQMFALVQDIPGFIRAERFKSLKYDDKLLSLSEWESEEAVMQWRERMEHVLCQQEGRNALFAAYTITIVNVMRKYDYCNDNLQT